MQAIILAAGRGRRLWPLTADNPKCLLPLHGRPLLAHQLDILERHGVDDALIVCSGGSARIRDLLAVRTGSLRPRCWYNPLATVSDNLLSLWTVRRALADDLILVNGDVVFHPELLAGLLAVGGPATLTVSRQTSYSEDDMRVRMYDGRVLRVGKDLPGPDTDATSVGVMRFTGPGAAGLRRSLEAVTERPQAYRAYFLEAVQWLVDQGLPVTAWECGSLPWVDVDTPEDLDRARALGGRLGMEGTVARTPGGPT